LIVQKKEMSKVVIKAENISKQYRLGLVGTGTIKDDMKRWWYKMRGAEDPFLKIGDANDRTSKGESDYVWSLKDINFEINQGDSVGIIGRNGAGKSTLLKILSQVTQPTTGKIFTKGRIASLLEVGTGFHPELTGRENIFLNGAILGMRKHEIAKKLDEIIAFSGVERYIDTPVKRYSSGMYVRLAFAVAAHLESEILIVDEVLAVGDADFQKKCLGKMNDVSKGEGRTVLFVSHNMAAVKSLCSHSIMLENGILTAYGETETIIDNYLTNQSNYIGKKTWAVNKPKNQFLEVDTIYAHDINGFSPKDSCFNITKEIGITVKYRIFEDGYSFIHGANFFNSEEINIFNTHDVTLNNRYEKKNKGEYSVTMWIPPNLLSEGVLKISFAFFKPNPFELFLNLDKEICINIVDNLDQISAKGGYLYNFPGYVRPLLNWEINKL